MSRRRIAGRAPATVLAVLFLAGAAPQQARGAGDLFPGLYAAGIGAGLVDPEDRSATIGFLGRLDLGELAADFSLLPTAEYWRKSDRVLGTRVFSRDLTLGADLRFYVNEGETRFYVGPGLALHFLKSEVESGGGEVEDTDTKIGGVVLAGATFEHTDELSWFGEVKYRFVTSFNTFKILGGVSLHP